MNLRAHNLSIFVQIAEGIDSETWMFHLRRGDYSNWIRNAIKDKETAGQVAAVEQDEGIDEKASRSAIKDFILQKYTTPE